MKAKLHEIEVPRQVTKTVYDKEATVVLTLTMPEARMLRSLIGSVCGEGPIWRFTSYLYRALCDLGVASKRDERNGVKSGQPSLWVGGTPPHLSGEIRADVFDF